MNAKDPIHSEHRALLTTWMSLVRDRAKRLAQREHEAIAEQWDRHRSSHLDDKS
jgi:hypothetical protein